MAPAPRRTDGMPAAVATRLLRAVGLLLILPVALGAEGFNLYRVDTPLTSDRGHKAAFRDWAGKEAIVSMEYSNCRFVCSITLQRLKDVQAAADRAGRRFEFLIVSLDPKNDTPAAWTRYRKTRELDRANWHFLTAAEKETPLLARLLGVRWWLYDEHIMHDFRLLRIDAAGQVVGIMETYDADVHAFVR